MKRNTPPYADEASLDDEAVLNILDQLGSAHDPIWVVRHDCPECGASIKRREETSPYAHLNNGVENYEDEIEFAGIYGKTNGTFTDMIIDRLGYYNATEEEGE